MKYFGKILVVSVLALAGCGKRPPAPTAISPSPLVQFVDVTAKSGIDFTHFNGAMGNKFMPETMGSGCAFIDYDNDGKLDILVINGNSFGDKVSRPSPTMHLYRNLDGVHFKDVTIEVGLDIPMYGMGVAVGDFDNDGYDDVYVTGVGSSKLFHNVAGIDGKRRFLDITNSAGVESPGWATSATWIDYDRDGKLDLFVCHYVKWNEKTDQYYSLDSVHKSYSTPQQYEGESCRLYHNDGNGKFTDVSKKSGIFNTKSKALGVTLCDFDQDGWPDLIVANDTVPNFLFHNEGNGTFKEVAIETGIGIAETGKAKAGMGVDVADEMHNGHESIVISNFAGEQLTLFRWVEGGQYLDTAARSGIGNATQLYLGFGVLFLDYDGDGWPDILVANGHIQEDALNRQTGVRYKEPSLLFRNLGVGNYSEVTSSVGKALNSESVGRGAAWGDFDNDGHPDILLTSNAGRVRLLKNVNLTGNHWIRIELQGKKSNRNGIGSRVRIKYGTEMQTGIVRGSCSYLSSSDRRLLFGLGSITTVDSIEIQWPGGDVQTINAPPCDKTVHIIEPR